MDRPPSLPYFQPRRSFQERRCGLWGGGRAVRRTVRTRMTAVRRRCGSRRSTRARRVGRPARGASWGRFRPSRSGRSPPVRRGLGRGRRLVWEPCCRVSRRSRRIWLGTRSARCRPTPRRCMTPMRTRLIATARPSGSRRPAHGSLPTRRSASGRRASRRGASDGHGRAAVTRPTRAAEATDTDGGRASCGWPCANHARSASTDLVRILDR
jgi:hypothetical protein